MADHSARKQAAEEAVIRLVDEITTMILEPIENGAADLGIPYAELMDRVAEEVKTTLASWEG